MRRHLLACLPLVLLSACGGTEPAPALPLHEAVSQTSPTSNGMLAYYKFEYGSTPSYTLQLGDDFSGNAQSAVVYGTVQRLQSYNGRWAASFGGSGVLAAPGNYYSGAISNQFEASALICPTGSSSTGNVIVMRQGMFILKTDRNPSGLRVVKASIFSGGVERSVYGSTQIVVSSPYCQWQDIGASYDGTTLKVYYNGQVDGSASAPGPLDHPSTGSLFVGGDRSCGANSCLTAGWKGMLDDVKIQRGNGPCTRTPNKAVLATYQDICSAQNQNVSESIVDDDNDGLDDCVEEKLVDSYAMQVWRDVNDSCPGPVSPRQIRTCHTRVDGPLGWVGTSYSYQRVDISCAVLYDYDCGLLGHPADIEPYQISVVHADPTGTGLTPGLRSDRNLANWSVEIARTEAHQGTVNEKINDCNPGENCPNVFAAQNKHGNYLSPQSCNNLTDSCGSMVWVATFRNLDVGEQSYPRIGDLGQLVSNWTGYSPWDGRTFLGGGAGAIRDKLNLQAPHRSIDCSVVAPGCVYSCAY